MAETSTAPPQAKKRKKGKGKDNTPVMEGQTEEERRILRQEQRTLVDRIADRAADMTNMDDDAYANEHTNTNALFKKVRYTREMVNDGDILVSLAECATKRSANLQKSVQPYQASAIGKALANEYVDEDRGGIMDWVRLGTDCAGLFRAPPELAFLCGPLEKPERERKAAQRRKRAAEDDGEEETGYEETTGRGAGGAQKEEATNLRLQKLSDVMRTRATERDGSDLMSLVVNPDSFCETVENLFDLSFLVKDGKAALAIDAETGLPTVTCAEPPEEAVPKTQNVVVLSMQDCRDIGELWKITGKPLARDNDDE